MFRSEVSLPEGFLFETYPHRAEAIVVKHIELSEPSFMFSVRLMIQVFISSFAAVSAKAGHGRHVVVQVAETQCH